MSPPQLYVLAGGGTPGWSVSARELAGALRRCEVEASVVDVPRPREVRTFALTDLAAALAARRTASRLERTVPVIYCSITAALLWPRPGAIWLDTLAAENRPGRHGTWQRPVERRRLAQAPIVMTMSAGAVPDGVVVPVPVQASGPAVPWPARDISAITYVGDPAKKRTSLVLDAWRRARAEGETLLVAGAGGEDEPGVRWVGRLPRSEYRTLLRRARVFIAAPRIEDYGTAQLEALADGCVLVTTSSARGPYAARAIAREADPRLVVDTDDALPGAIRTALDDPRPGYADAARVRLTLFSPDAVDQALRERVLPVLLPG